MRLGRTAGRPAGRWPPSDLGSGAVIALAVLGASCVLALAALAVCGAAVEHRRVSAAADAGALAAADVVSGYRSGDACSAAVRLVEANGAVLVACDVIDRDAVVTARGALGGLVIEVSARAGPPDQSKTASR